MTLTEKPVAIETPAPTRHLPIAQLVAGGVLLVIGALWLIERLGWVDLTVTAVLGIATMVVGIALMALAREGTHVGLIILGTVLGLLATLTAVAPFEGFQGGVGDHTYVIDTVDDIQSDYNLAMGKLVIDVTDLDDLEVTTKLTASVGTGDLIVRVPADMEVAVEANAGAGQIVIFETVREGVGVTDTYETAGYDEASARLDLVLDVFAGRVEVRNG